jgi:hypothetical protein
MSNKIRTILLTLFVGTIASFFYFSYTYQQIFTQKQLKKNIANKLDQRLYPGNIKLYTIGRDSVNYPYVRIKPGEGMYIIARLLEKKNFLTSRYDQTFFANKRIAELEKWGNEIPVLEIAHNTQQLSSWWKLQKPQWYEFNNYGRFNSWESELARYLNNMETQIVTIKGYSDEDSRREYLMGDVENQIYNNHNKLIEIVHKSQMNPQKKEYLSKHIEQIYAHLFNQAIGFIPSEDPYPLEYSLTSILSTDRKDRYNIYVDNAQPLNNRSEVILKVGDTKLLAESNDFDINRTKSTLAYKNVSIDPSQKILTVSPPRFAMYQYKPTQWYQEEKPEQGTFVYYVDIPLNVKQTKYFVEATFEETQPVNIQLQQLSHEYTYNIVNANQDRFKKIPVYIKQSLPFKFIMSLISLFVRGDNTPVVIINTVVSEDVQPGAKTFYKPVEFSYKWAFFKNRIAITSSTPVAKLPTVTLYPILVPNVIVQRSFDESIIRNYKVDKTTFNLKSALASVLPIKNIKQPGGLYSEVSQEQSVQGSLITFFILLGALSILLSDQLFKTIYKNRESFLDRFYRKTERNIAALLKNSFSLLYSIALRYPRLLILLSCTLIVIQVLSLGSNFDLFVLGVILLWVLGTLYYKVGAQVHLLFGFGFYMLAVVCFTVIPAPSQTILSLVENVSSWAYVFFLIGTFQLFVEYLFHFRKNNTSLSEFMTLLITDSPWVNLMRKYVPWLTTKLSFVFLAVNIIVILLIITILSILYSYFYFL